MTSKRVCFIVLVFICITTTKGAISPWTEDKTLSPRLRVKRAIDFAFQEQSNLEAIIKEDLTRPFVRGNTFTTALSLYPNLEMVVVTSTLPYKTKYADDKNAPTLVLTFKDKSGVNTTKEYKYTTLSAQPGKRLIEIDWTTAFFPLTSYTKTLSFLKEPDVDTTKAFVAFISYPVSNVALSNPTFGKKLFSIQMKGGENKDSYDYPVVGNIFIDHDFEVCRAFFNTGFSQDYKEAMKDWDKVLESTLWSEGRHVSLFMTLSIQGFFCFPMVDYIFFGETSKISTQWKYCNKYLEDTDNFNSDPCCNRLAPGKCNTYKERMSTNIGKDNVCMFDFLNYKDLNLTNRQKVELNIRSFEMEEVTQYFHDTHFSSLPSILWNFEDMNQKKRSRCRNIFNDQSVYIAKFSECPIDIHLIDGFPADSSGCYTPTDNQAEMFINMCVPNIGENDRIARYNTTTLQVLASLSFGEDKVVESVFDPAHPNYCYAYDGRHFNSKDDNPNCEGYVCDVKVDRWVFKTKEEALSKCPQLATKCAIQNQGCGIGDNVKRPANVSDIGDSFKRFVSVLDITPEECTAIKGIDLTQMNSNTDDDYECLSQVVGCAEILSPEFVHCDEASMLTNVFMFNERTLPRAETFRLKRATADTPVKSSVKTLTPNYEDSIKVFYVKYIAAELTQRAPVFFEFFNREISTFITDCFFVGKDKFQSYIGVDFPLTVMTLNRDKSELFSKIELIPSPSQDDLKMTQFDRCYACGSTAIFGTIDGSVKIKGSQYPLLNYWNDKIDEAKDNLGFRMTIKYNDSIGGRDESFTIGYIVGDAVKFTEITTTNHSTIYMGISEISTVDFTEASTYPINDFLRIRNMTENGQSKFWIEPLYLECVQTSSDENKFVFDFVNSYVLCKVPESVYLTFTKDDGILPIYRLPKNKIKKDYPKESDQSKILAIVLPTVFGCLFVLVVFSIIIFAVVRYRIIKGRRLLKEYNEEDLTSLGGPLLQFE
ncbi:hypothetical protein EIN_369390 [Entamoeba invadens IP1]|uniref:Uncharacterized protein n=1 Tax=Entamoeba invadens IP1 TaxID=370355 RepID=A0A0A1UGF3_ENTIV|nr:hypothetical protein EIN_369390 [Entamoeba invadens IP1]ELP92617.1 hypothetical protein EIN_369390 [Entamoeba invadens IP1]|eukprot:XP_004259388.1 hypothetical protein EIN_369390 [Entamoeba invadens IP1]